MKQCVIDYVIGSPKPQTVKMYFDISKGPLIYVIYGTIGLWKLSNTPMFFYYFYLSLFKYG